MSQQPSREMYEMMDTDIKGVKTLKELSRQQLQLRQPHILCDEYWQDGEKRTTPQTWLSSATELDIMKLSDASRMLLLAFENSQIVGSRMSGKIDEICIRFIDFDKDQHKQRIKMQNKSFGIITKDDNHDDDTVKDDDDDVCSAEVHFRMNSMCLPHILIDGSEVPPRTLWIEVCTSPNCATRQSRHLSNLDMIQLYPTAKYGTKVTVVQMGKTIAHKCLHAVLEFVRMEQRKISKLYILNLKKDKSLSNGECTSMLATLASRDHYNGADDISCAARDWVCQFRALGAADQLDALTLLVNSSCLAHLRHLHAATDPYLQIDIISFLARETATYILSMLPAADLLRCAAVSRRWRTLAEDNWIWFDVCTERGLLRYDTLPSHSLDGACVLPSPPPQRPSFSAVTAKTRLINTARWKALYIRSRRIESKWRQCPQYDGDSSLGPTTTVFKGHDEHVITCLQVQGNTAVTGSDDSTLKVWDIDTSETRHVLTGHMGGVWSSTLSPDGSTVVSGSTDRTVRVWNTHTGVCVHTLIGHTSTVRCMALSGILLATGSRDTTLRLWNIETGQCLHVLGSDLRNGHIAPVRCVAFDGKRIVSGSYDYMVKVWDPESGRCRHTLTGHQNRVYTVVINSQRDIAATGSLDTTIKVWNLDNGTLVHTLVGHQSLTSGMAVNGSMLVSGNADATVRVWDLVSGVCTHELAGPHRHQSTVTSLALLPYGLVVTSSDDGTAKLWDGRTGAFVRTVLRLESAGAGGCIWGLSATATRLVCAAGSRNNTEDNKLIVIDFNAPYP